jgi:hypothetical protein
LNSGFVKRVQPPFLHCAACFGFACAGPKNVDVFTLTFRRSTVCSLSSNFQPASVANRIAVTVCEPSSASASAYVP